MDVTYYAAARTRVWLEKRGPLEARTSRWMDGWMAADLRAASTAMMYIFCLQSISPTTNNTCKLLLLVSSRAARRPRRTRAFLLEDPAGEGALVLGDALGEPAVKRARAVNNSIDEDTNNDDREEENARYSQLDLVLGGLDRVGAVADVAADGERKVAADGACGAQSVS